MSTPLTLKDILRDWSKADLLRAYSEGPPHYPAEAFTRWAPEPTGIRDGAAYWSHDDALKFAVMTANEIGILERMNVSGVTPS